MHYCNCGDCCEPVETSALDRKIVLEEHKAILEAKLATVKEMIKNLDSAHSENPKK